LPKLTQVTHRAEIEKVLPPAPFAHVGWWCREVVAQLLCLRAELAGRNITELARDVLPEARRNLTEQPQPETLRDLLGRR
jgi:hypothetical protein